MNDWDTEEAESNQTQSSYKAGQAGERLFLLELGTTAANLAQYDVDEIEKPILEEIGRTLDPHIIKTEVPSLLQVKYNLATNEECVNDVSLQEANEERNELLVKTIPQEEREEIIKHVIEEF